MAHLYSGGRSGQRRGSLKSSLSAAPGVLSIALALAVGCSGESPPELGPPPVQSPPVRTVAGLVIRPEIALVAGGAEGDSLQVRLMLSHTGKHALQLQAGACGLEVYLYPTAARRAPAPWAGGRFGPCLRLVRIHLAPGDVVTPWEFTFSKPIQAILGDSLPEGRYYASASTALGYWVGEEAGEAIQRDIWPDTLVWLPVGEATLRHGARTRPRS